MAQDFYIDPNTHDWALDSKKSLRLCGSKKELIRQRLAINLKLFLGEWFADSNLGVPYFESVYGKVGSSAADAVFEMAILGTEGVLSIKDMVSTIDKETRTYKLVFSVRTEDGDIDGVEI